MTAPRWALFHRFDIPDSDGVLYLRRWYLLQTPWFSILMHKIMTPDKDRDPHDHQWPFLSIVLRGGYDEDLAVRDRDGEIVEACGSGVPFMLSLRRRWLSFAFRRATDVHRITRLHRSPTWTLLFTGRRVRDWGFHVDGEGFVPWRRYLSMASALLALLLASCCGPRPSEALTWLAVAPEYLRYVAEDPSLSRQQKDDRALLVETWRLRAGVSR